MQNNSSLSLDSSSGAAAFGVHKFVTPTLRLHQVQLTLTVGKLTHFPTLLLAEVLRDKPLS